MYTLLNTNSIMKRFILLSFALLCIAMSSLATEVITDKDGNYVSTSKVVAKDSVTGKTFITPDGKKYSVFVSGRGKLYIIRVSKKGITYKQYLQVK